MRDKAHHQNSSQVEDRFSLLSARGEGVVVINRFAPLVVTLLGLAGAAFAWNEWQPCNTPQTPDCYAALNDHPGELTQWLVWLGASLVCIVGLRERAGRSGAAVALMLVVIANPLLDPGFLFGDWNSADGAPGTGVIGGAVIAAAGVIFGALAAIDHVRIARGRPALSDGPQENTAPFFTG